MAQDTVDLEHELRLTDSLRQQLATYQPGDMVRLRVDEITEGSCTPVQLYWIE